MGELSSWKVASLLGNNIWTIRFTWLPKMSTYSLTVILPFRVITEQVEYQNIAAQIITDLLPCFKLEQAFRIVGFLEPSPNIDPA